MHERLAEAMQRKGVSQAQLARELDVSAASVSGWCSGTKRPTTANLMQIAAFLGVEPGYLQFGDAGQPKRSAAELTAARLAYSDRLGWYWRPAPRDQGREYGNAAGYAFAADIETLGRESGQNISDEKLTTEPTVEARFTISELTGDKLSEYLERLRFHEVREHLEAACSNRKAGATIERGLAQVDNGRLLFIRIDDFNANGLTGAEFQTGRFMAVVRNVLDSQKGDSAGGSFGLGKATLWSTSQFGLVLVNSTLSVADGGLREGRFIGRIDLPWHETPNGEFAGPGWFGRPDETDPDPEPKRTVSDWGDVIVHEDFGLARPEGTPGTSFLIVGAYDASGEVETVEEIAERLSESLADNFWPAMVDGPDDTPARFRAIVRAERDHKKLSETYINPAHYQPQRVAAYLRHLEGDVAEQLEESGDVVRLQIPLRVPARTSEPTHGAAEEDAILLVTQAPDSGSADRGLATAPGRVEYMRGSQMVIQRQLVGALPVGARAFHAMVLTGEAAGDEAADRAADRFLRAAEPPAHNKWTGTPDLTASYERGGRAALEAFEQAIKKAIREIIKQPSKDLSDGPDALKELLRLVPPKPDGKRPRIKSVRKHGISQGGAWVITEATVTLPARKDGRGWTVMPVLRFGTESGPTIPVEWAELEPVSQCQLDSQGRLTMGPKVRTAKFSAVSQPASHPVGASRAKVLIDVRVFQAGGSQS